MRQLLTYWPPRIVSAKWTFQLSRSSLWLSAAAMPPSAITVCALPSSDLQMRPTVTPLLAASMAARNPAPPAPMIRTSYEYVGTLQDPRIGPDPHRAEADVDVGERHREQARPRKELMAVVQRTRAG